MAKKGLLLAIIVALGACGDENPSAPSRHLPGDTGQVDNDVPSDVSVTTDAGGDTQETQDTAGDAPDAQPDTSEDLDASSDAVEEPDTGQDTNPDPTLIHLLGGDPLQTGEAPWNRAGHSQQPTALWGAIQGPYPTNAWWQNLVLGEGLNLTNALPYLIKTLPGGIQASVPYKVVEPNYSFTYFQGDIQLGAAEELVGRSVVDFGPLSVTMRWSHTQGTVTAPIVRGMPYVTAIYESSTPKISTQHAIVRVNEAAPNGTTQPLTRFTLEFNNGQTWRLYASQPLRLLVQDSTLTALEPFSGSLRAANINQDSGDLLDQYSEGIPTGAQVTATAQGNNAELVFDWEFQGAGPLLMMALPHQLDVIEDVQLTPLVQNTIKGNMRGVTGQIWTLLEPLTTIAWDAPRPIDAEHTQEIRAALREDQSFTVRAQDPYFGGKEMAALARLALIADSLSEPGLAAGYRQRLAASLEPWLQGTNPQELVYDYTWGGVVSSQGISDPGAAFGQGYYNDHHFHYGYLIYAAAVLAKDNPAWAQEHGDAVLHLIRDIAEPSANDPLYTYMRHKDWFVGHSWAAGLFEFGDGRNQESTSEAVNAWYAVYLYGLATANDRVRDLGRLMLGTELRSSWRYWQITTASDIYPQPFQDRKVVGVLWDIKVDHTTFFGNNIEFIHCIQMLPFTPISESLLRRAWLAESYPIVSSALDNPELGEGWRGFIIMANGVLDPDTAWRQAQSLTSYDNGNTRTNTLYWLATRP